MKKPTKYILFCTGAVIILTTLLFPTSGPGEVNIDHKWMPTQFIYLSTIWESKGYAPARVLPVRERGVIYSSAGRPDQHRFAWKYWLLLNFAPGLLVGAALAKQKYYLTFSGRIDRGQYWLTGLLPNIVLLYLGIIIDIKMLNNPDVPIATTAIMALWALPMLSVLVRRCRDRNLPIIFLLLFLVPILNLWPAIELAFLPGKEKDEADDHETVDSR